jgi:hypothetical protein
VSDALVVMNPRNIRVCLDSMAELPIPKIYLRGFSEREIATEAFPRVMAMGYRWLWVVSDDVVARPCNLLALRDLRDAGHPVVTGYSQRSHTEWTVNLTDGPLVGDVPHPDAYRFRTFRDVVSWPVPEVPTWFTGMSMTGMRTELWAEYPFDCYGGPDEPGYASDFSLSFRLQSAGVPILAARDAFLYHWRHEWVNTSDPRDADPILGAKEIFVSPSAVPV